MGRTEPADRPVGAGSKLSGGPWPVRRRVPAIRKRTAGVRHLLAAYDPATGRLYGHPGHQDLARGARAGEHDIKLVYLPTYASWRNLIECQFQALRPFALNGIDYQSHAEQDGAIRAYLRWRGRGVLLRLADEARAPSPSRSRRSRRATRRPCARGVARAVIGII